MNVSGFVADSGRPALGCERFDVRECTSIRYEERAFSSRAADFVFFAFPVALRVFAFVRPETETERHRPQSNLIRIEPAGNGSSTFNPVKAFKLLALSPQA